MSIDTITEPSDLAVGGRPLTAKGRATRARIVVAASRLVLENGVEHTTVDDIQREATVNASQLYHYFADKNELIHAVIDHQTEGVLAIHRPALTSLNGFDGLQAWRDLVVDLVRGQGCVGGCPIGSLASNLAESDAAARQVLQESFATWEELLRDGLSAMRDNGTLGPQANPATLALALLAAVQGGLLLSQTRRDTLALEAALDTAIAHLRTLTPQLG